MKRWLWLVGLVLWADVRAADLVELMGDRLALAREVAWLKYRDGRPVRDPAREAEVLAAVTAAAESRGLDAARVRAFFAAQIEASCAQQEKWIYLWRRGATPLPVFAPREPAEVRREIDAVNRRLLGALAESPVLARAKAERALRERGVFWRAAREAVAPL